MHSSEGGRDPVLAYLHTNSSVNLQYLELSAHVNFSLKKYQKFKPAFIIGNEKTTLSPVSHHFKFLYIWYKNSKIPMNGLCYRFDIEVTSNV